MFTGCPVQVLTNFLAQLREFVDQYCAQYALLGLQMLWTSDVQAALSGDRKRPLKDVVDKANSVLAELSSWCLHDLGTPLNRYNTALLCNVLVLLRRCNAPSVNTAFASGLRSRVLYYFVTQTWTFEPS